MLELLQLVSAMLTVDAGGGLPTFQAAQAEAMALLAINVYRTGFVTAQLLCGTWLFPLGYLVYKSGLLPRFLGGLLILDGVGEMIWLLQAFLLPAYPQIKVPGTVVSFVAEVGLAVWLLIEMTATTQPREIWTRASMLGLGGAAGFWVTNFAISLTPIAAEHRTALAICTAGPPVPNTPQHRRQIPRSRRPESFRRAHA